jgi:hypothetical protein
MWERERERERESLGNQIGKNDEYFIANKGNKVKAKRW